MDKPIALAIYRAVRFSPNAAERDKAIMDEVCNRLHTLYNINKVEEDDLGRQDIIQPVLEMKEKVRLVVSMARSIKTLDTLKEMESQGVRIINSPKVLLKASRSSIDRTMRENGIPAAPKEGNTGWWIKRGDEAAQQKSDVTFAPTEDKLNEAINSFNQRGIKDIVVTAHVKGDLVKFYGVEGTKFFRTFYPTDGSYSKFGDEQLNGKARHFQFCAESLYADADKLAKLTGIEVYGGDAIIRKDGSYAIIDFNDWPSFAACRKEAAIAICDKITKETNKTSACLL